jgi:conjugative relaxase-like TrwC/TraI family protein
VKSVSVLWGIADDRTRAAIEACHDEAWRTAIDRIERDVLYARQGTRGIAHAEVDGLAAVAFVHRTSRTGDPQLHTHVVAGNKVRTRSGKWLTLDGALLYKANVAASETYNTRVEALLAERLGLAFEDRAGNGVREVAGMPDELVASFAKRRLAVKARFAELLAEHRSNWGEPDHETEFKLAQRACLETRPAKLRTAAAGERAAWRDACVRTLGVQPDDLVAEVLDRGARVHAPDARVHVDELAACTLEGVQARRAEWTPLHVRAEAERVARREGVPVADLDAVVDQVVERTLATPGVLKLTPGPLVEEPAALRLPNGDPVWRSSLTHRYTTTAVRDAEAALAAGTTVFTAPAVRPIDVECRLLQLEADGLVLSPDQRTAALELLGSGRMVELLVAPAGAGKSRTMAAVTEVWEGECGRVVALAPTARAARELGEAADVEAQTIDRWLTQLDAGLTQVEAGDLVLVDEAGMAGTLTLEALRRQVEGADAKLLLVGDHRQLAAVGAGGALRHVYNEAGAVELSTLWRFRAKWEKDATLGLRDGQPAVLDTYLDHGRVHDGARSELVEGIYRAWAGDTAAGRSTLMLAVQNATVAELNDRARRDRVAAGAVEADGVQLADGCTAGVGDTIMTTRNRSDLRCARDYVRNGDLWDVTAVTADGGLQVEHRRHHGRVVLPADYVTAGHVALGYASTVARAQGATVANSRLLVDGRIDRANLYVGMTRGARVNEAWVVTREEVGLDVDVPRQEQQATARELLAEALARVDGQTAHEAIRAELDAEWGTKVMRRRYDHAVELLEKAGLAEPDSGGPPAGEHPVAVWCREVHDLLAEAEDAEREAKKKDEPTVAPTLAPSSAAARRRRAAAAAHGQTT